MIKKLNAAKAILIILLAVLLFFIGRPEVTKQLPAEMLQALYEQDAQAADMVQGDTQALMRLYGIDADDIGAFLLYYPKASTDVDELLILQTKDGKMGTYTALVKERLATQKTAFDGYGMEQSGLLEKSKVVVYGDCLFFGVSDQVGLWKERFLSAIKKS
ncbi:MAG: DUF4358 domain-containing protein [Lachnospiraceae bacterium]|nr:DUF4358 domain-containing protein [Lachnospiraceae bacterium]